MSRRSLLAAGGLTALAGGGATAVALQGERGATAAAVVPFRGHHQAGILTPRQQHARLAAFDFGARTDRGRAAALLLCWTSAAEHLTRGGAVPPPPGPPPPPAPRTPAPAPPPPP
ncbi:Dyp-type peroxidase domain-containing protein, partial [Streptomyces yangpuensis]|uniref:Dyp-type peroxidase domain-containing protein n=1 Tax=Streptomyces yangpuensis TaxID=1648182 RepID=UPI0036AC6786